MTKFNVGFSRRVEVAIEVEIVAAGLSTESVMEGLTSGMYEVMIGTGEIIDCNGNVVARYSEYEEADEFHGDFELFEE